MNPRRARSLLWSTTVLLAVASAAVVVAAARWPYEMGPAQPSATTVAPKPPTTGPASMLPPLAGIQPLWQRAWRRPLYDPPPALPPVLVEAPLNIGLLGTIMEQGGVSLAIVQLPGGKTQLIGIGEEAAGAKVLRIEPDRMTVLLGGKERLLVVAKPPGPTSN